MNRVLIFVNPRAVHPKKQEVFFGPHDMKKFLVKNDNAYCNMCLKKGVMYVCASRDHDRIHCPIGGFHLCQVCFDLLCKNKYIEAQVVQEAKPVEKPIQGTVVGTQDNRKVPALPQKN